MSQTDEEIAARVQRGDTEQFGMLVTRFEAKISRYARKFLRTAEDREDLVQEVFLKAFINIQSFDTSRRFSPWLYRIAHNEFVNAIRKSSRQPFQLFDFDTFFPELSAKETADGDTNRFEISREMETCLAELPVKYREPIVLYHFEELHYDVIAEILHIPISTVGVRLNRGKQRLKDIYETNFGKNHD